MLRFLAVAVLWLLASFCLAETEYVALMQPPQGTMIVVQDATGNSVPVLVSGSEPASSTITSISFVIYKTMNETAASAFIPITPVLVHGASGTYGSTYNTVSFNEDLLTPCINWMTSHSSTSDPNYWPGEYEVRVMVQPTSGSAYVNQKITFDLTIEMLNGGSVQNWDQGILNNSVNDQHAATHQDFQGVEDAVNGNTKAINNLGTGLTNAINNQPSNTSGFWASIFQAVFIPSQDVVNTFRDTLSQTPFGAVAGVVTELFNLLESALNPNVDALGPSHNTLRIPWPYSPGYADLDLSPYMGVINTVRDIAAGAIWLDVLFLIFKRVVQNV